jgi:mycothiol synthase
MTDGARTSSSAAVTPDEEAAVLALVQSAADHDGYSALNEAAVLHLRHPRSGILHFLARRDGALLGYAQLDSEREPDTDQLVSTAQLVVAPEHRRQRLGTALLTELVARTPARLRIWAQGNSAAAQGLARSQGLVPARELMIMTRPLAGALPQAPVPPGVRLRTFVVGQDEDAWLAVNARAFAHHPEQGQLTRADLLERMAEPWFDAEGFFVAGRDDPATGDVDGDPGAPALIGFHWTKEHPDRVGEVYVLGVDPSAGGGGLGKALLARGLQHLQDRGLGLVQLYVEADHERAVSLYRGYGFTESSRDVMYAQP